MAPMLQALLSHLAAELLCSRLHPDVIDPAAGNALLALIVAQQAHWQAMVTNLLGARPRTRATPPPPPSARCSAPTA